jgi:transcription initiation factor TFIIH subunit 2
MADDNDLTSYAWQGGISRTWEVLEEDESGLLKSLDVRHQRERRARFGAVEGRVRRGMIRFFVVILDFSSGIRETDFPPSRQVVVVNAAVEFVREFFDQNPLSHLSLVATTDRKARVLSELSGNPNQHISILRNMLNPEWFEATMKPEGAPSLQNSLEVAHVALEGIPQYGSREVLVLYNSLRTEDPGNVFESLQKLANAKIRASVVALGGEVHICQRLAEMTGGSYAVAMDAKHYHDLVFAFCSPPPQSVNDILPSNLVPMGFPERTTQARTSQSSFSLCTCHGEATRVGFQCPRCGSKYCDLPVDCRVCGLTLVISPHLARSYHHLFPVALFEEVRQGPKDHCFACQRSLDPSQTEASQCPSCRKVYCFECDIFIHESLHNCPGCEVMGCSTTVQNGNMNSSSSSSSSSGTVR